MSNIYAEHPHDAALERFALDRSDTTELDIVETHVMACTACIRRLETVELETAAIKLALQEMHQERVAKAARRDEQFSWRSWITLPRLSMAGAALAVGIFIVFPIATQNAPVKLHLVAYRGVELPIAPKNHRLQVHLSANDPEQSAVEARIVDDGGAELWKAITPVTEGGVDINVPAISQSGVHFFRIYSLSASGRSEVLREFAFQVK
jgi:hypothetical protein